MFSQPELREVMKEQGAHFAREHNLLFIDECSALADIGITPLFNVLVLSIIETQKLLVAEGKKTAKALRMRDEDLTLQPEVRKCCY